MKALLAFSRAVDWINERIGRVASWCVLIACLVSAGNALSRYTLSATSNAWLEIQWYLFAAIFLLGAPYTLKVNEHVRVDVIYAHVSPRARLWIDLVGGLLFLLPATVLVGWLSWSFFAESYRIGEMSSNAGGLLRWPVKLIMVVGFALLSLQGVSEVIKRIAALTGRQALIQNYQQPVQ